jgi:hypothetical protein
VHLLRRRWSTATPIVRATCAPMPAACTYLHVSMNHNVNLTFELKTKFIFWPLFPLLMHKPISTQIIISTLSSSMVNPRPRRSLRLYRCDGQRTTGRSRPLTGRGATASAFVWTQCS